MRVRHNQALPTDRPQPFRQVPSRHRLASVLPPLASFALATAIGIGVANDARAQSTVQAEPSHSLLGDFADDYGVNYRITKEHFEQLPRTRYRIVEWHNADRYGIAPVDSANTRDGGRWARIDWSEFRDMPPCSWGFCLTTWNAPTADAARGTPPANRETPRTGCGGFPFSRMRRPDSSVPPHDAQ